MKRQLKLTEFARTGADFSLRFGGKFLNVEFNGYRAVVTVPKGVSTEGGKQALQHIALERESGSKLTVGSVNVVTKTAKLRTYECMAGLHQIRFRGREPFPVPESEYRDFLDQVRDFVVENEMQVTYETEPPEMPQTMSEPPATGSSSGLIWIIAAVVVAAAAVATLLFLRGHIF